MYRHPPPPTRRSREVILMELTKNFKATLEDRDLGTDEDIDFVCKLLKMKLEKTNGKS
ncbi:hypothetical protein smaug_105 [Salmonella phage smaug]|uniref:Uncharacterized protein n=2 Tax=Epseptimavirus TaxID=2732017 RepID=A0A6G8RCN8_9CAUD|nr:hypothetical protein phagemcphageface_93 [Salmonella phage phagemcphageface]QIO01032.1 hypothetical protein smaug_105 [Salmonella phage smaug]